jgi:hypothetical protein
MGRTVTAVQVHDLHGFTEIPLWPDALPCAFRGAHLQAMREAAAAWVAAHAAPPPPPPPLPQPQPGEADAEGEEEARAAHGAARRAAVEAAAEAAAEAVAVAQEHLLGAVLAPGCR